jgi:serine/threonine protein kinase
MLVVMEYLKGGELYDYWSRFKERLVPEMEAKEIMLQLSEAIDYCHVKKIIHRDLKFQNILLTEKIDELPTAKSGPSKIHLKVVDFGIFGTNRGIIAEKSNAGSLRYMAPEVLQGRTGSDPKIDIWSMGVILYSLVFGRYPFSNSNKEKLRQVICEKELVIKRVKPKSIRLQT